MSHIAFFLATHWGRRLGGINVFNQGLARALATEISPVGKCYCFVESADGLDLEENVKVELCPSFSSFESVARQVHATLAASDDLASDVIIIGHDVHTGFLAIEAAARLKELQVPSVRAAVIRHMHYKHYNLYRGDDRAKREDGEARQRELIDRADIVFAVGPLLADSAYGSESNVTVHALIPGAPEIDSVGLNQEPAWQVFMSGRLGQGDDRIKNARLAVSGLLKAYAKAKEVNPPGQGDFRNRGRMTLFGANPGESELLQLSAKVGAHFVLEALPYTNDSDVLFESLRRSHFALMPSWHEGFGLSGWEAICAGVPLICSVHSGLFQFLETQVWPSEATPMRDAVISIELTGNEDRDAEALSTAVLRMVHHYSHAKHSALRLSEYLQAKYTWSSCAKTVTKAIGWQVATSDDWQERQAFAKTTVLDPNAEDALISKAMNILDRGAVYHEWQLVCTALNTLSARGKIQLGTVGFEARAYLSKLSDSLENAIGKKAAGPANLRQSGELDVTWRFLAAASSVSGTLGDFVHLIKANLWRQICSDGFLLREFYYYYCRFTEDFGSEDDEVLGRIADVVRLGLATSDFQTRLARLAMKHPELLKVLQQADFDGMLPESAATVKTFQAQAAVPANVEPEHFATFVWLVSEDATDRVYGPDFLLDFIPEALGTDPLPRRWRGDKRFPAATLLGALSADQALDILTCFATDEDESVRWACLDIAFSRSFRSRIGVSYHRSGAGSGLSLTARLGSIVDAAVSYDGSHPWLQREFLRLFVHELEHRPSDFLAGFTLNDFPLSRGLLGRSILSGASVTPDILHPEVEEIRKNEAGRIRRILLVLPPIELGGGSERRNAPKTTTPPLGLGLVASALSRAGHFVEIADCHRFPALVDELPERAKDFDWIGLNVVLSTTKSAQQIVADIKARSPEVMVAIGGPAANLGVWQASSRDVGAADWEFTVRGNAEQNFVDLVALTGRAGDWPEIDGVWANPLNRRLLETHCGKWHFKRDLRDTDKALPEMWEPEVQLDRRVFRGPGGGYEPAPTRKRNQTYKEAHVVMSRGCEWNCTFCTERSILSGGERRRSTRSVLSELKALCSEHDNLRVQFIDDNLLPQIATRSADDEMAAIQDLIWTREFLAGLVGIRETTTKGFGWRGIFRLEDFLAYEKRIPGFVERLVQSGCSMLAFGIEHGNEKVRKKLKSNVISAPGNDEICDLVSRLRVSGIRTKGYFILGGAHDDEENAKETIDFALRSGVSLAYFAIYKEFVPAAMALRKSSLTTPEEAETFLTYKQLSHDLDQMFAFDASGKPLTEDPDEREVIYRDLHQLGFSFGDLVKYNDYHSDEGPAAAIMVRNAFNDKRAYFETLKNAYLRFYLRRDFVAEYEGLVANGY